MRMCMYVCSHARARVAVRMRVRACARLRVRVCVRMRVHARARVSVCVRVQDIYSLPHKHTQAHLWCDNT